MDFKVKFSKTEPVRISKFFYSHINIIDYSLSFEDSYYFGCYFNVDITLIGSHKLVSEALLFSHVFPNLIKSTLLKI